MVAPPVTRDNIYFYYGGRCDPNDVDNCFYVKVDTHEHLRASPTRLYHLLTQDAPAPVLTKKGVPSKRQPAAPKDEPAHFYTAQMYHYDLKPLKTKAPAKKALLAAFSGGKSLEIPKRILVLRNQLRDDWIAGSQSTNTQRQAMEQTTTGRQTTEKLTMAPQEPKEVIMISSDQGFAELAKAKPDPPKKDRALSTAAAKGNREKATESTDVKLPFGDMHGKFSVTAPRLSQQWDASSGDLLLKLAPSSRGRHLWASFHFGIIEGIMRCGKPPKTVGETCNFHWRGRETGEGQMYFGKDNTGTLTFLGNGRIRGVISGAVVGQTEFTCEKDHVRSKNIILQKSVPAWKTEFRRMNIRAYEAAATARWGKWSGDTYHTERAADSDTTICGTPSDYGDDFSDEDPDDPPVPMKALQGGHATTARASKADILSLDLEDRPPPVRTKQTARKTVKRVVESDRPIQKQEMQAGQSKSDSAPNKSEKLKEIDTEGDFVVRSPELGDSWYEASGDLTLKLQPSSTGRHLWGQFDFGIVSGVWRCTAPPTAVGGSCSFMWRGRESGEREMTFSEYNKGTITFLGDGRISGTIAADLFQAVAFTGERKPARRVKAWKKEWRDLNPRSHRAEEVGRWGGFHREDKYREKPAESDTSDGEDANNESDEYEGSMNSDEENVAL